MTLRVSSGSCKSRESKGEGCLVLGDDNSLEVIRKRSFEKKKKKVAPGDESLKREVS